MICHNIHPWEKRPGNVLLLQWEEKTFLSDDRMLMLHAYSWTYMISTSSQVNCSLVLTLEASITPHCVCTYLKIHNWSRIESMLTVNLYLNKLNKTKSSEDPLIYPMTSTETSSSYAHDTFVNKICRLHSIKLFYNSSL